MFDEADFDDVDAPLDDRGGKKRRLDKDRVVKTKRVGPVPDSAGAAGVYRFHTIHDAKFSPVASTATTKKFDEKFSCGDLWNNSTCHCLSCDLVRVMQTKDALQAAAAPTILLLDLDNYGFPQFKTRKIKPQEVVRSNIFIWCFYGACFERHFAVNPEEFIQRKPIAEQAVPERVVGTKAPREHAQPGAPKSSSPAGSPEANQLVVGSLWHSLHLSGRLYFTPCGGHSQAVDEAMMQVAQVLSEEHRVLFMSCDRHLTETANQAMGERNGSTVINPLAFQRDIIKVWSAIAEKCRDE